MAPDECTDRVGGIAEVVGVANPDAGQLLASTWYNGFIGCGKDRKVRSPQNQTLGQVSGPTVQDLMENVYCDLGIQT